MTADSFGRRASNNSATRGRPPVMSRVLALSVGIRAMTSPALMVSAKIDRQDGVDRQHVAGVAATRQLEDLAVLALDDDRRPQVGGAARRAPIDHDALGDAGRLVERFRQRLAFDEILERDYAFDLGQDRPCIGIPLSDPLAALDRVAIVDLQARAVLDAMDRTLGAVLVDDRNRHVARHRHQLAIGVAHHVLVLDLDLAIEIAFDERLLGDLRRAADVERAHRQLGARFADRLRRDDADRLAHVDRRAAGKIAPVAHAADAVGQFAGQHRTNADFLNASRNDRLDLRLFEQAYLS